MPKPKDVQKPVETTETVESEAEATENERGGSVKEEGIPLEGIVREALKGKFKVEIPSAKPGGKSHIVIAHLAGKLRKNFIKIVPGDSVKVEVSPYDFTKGRITFRNKG